MIIVVKACDFGYKVYGARLLLCLVVIVYFREVIPESEVCILMISKLAFHLFRENRILENINSK